MAQPERRSVERFASGENGLHEINVQLEATGLKVKIANGAIIDATFLQSAERPQAQADCEITTERDTETATVTVPPAAIVSSKDPSPVGPIASTYPNWGFDPKTLPRAKILRIFKKLKKNGDYARVFPYETAPLKSSVRENPPQGWELFGEAFPGPTGIHDPRHELSSWVIID